jgi:hypothetical protein
LASWFGDWATGYTIKKVVELALRFQAPLVDTGGGRLGLSSGNGGSGISSSVG